MNLHAIVGPIVGAVNPNITVSIRASAGYTTPASGRQTPAYAAAYAAIAQLQPLTYKDLMQVDATNQGGIKKAIYVSGPLDGVVRPTMQGGDLVDLPDGTTWLVTQVLEGFNLTAGWTKAAIVLQNEG